VRKTTFWLDEGEWAALQSLRDNHPKAYVRERALALLQIADGMSIRAVARGGLGQHRRWATVKEWLVRYREHGIAGPYIRPGRGRKPRDSIA
jgi:transposase